MKSYRCVLVEWLDSRGMDWWVPRDEAEACSISKITSVGWLIQSHKDRIVLSGDSTQSDEQEGRVIAIPRGCIIRMVDLEADTTSISEGG